VEWKVKDLRNSISRNYNSTERNLLPLRALPPHNMAAEFSLEEVAKFHGRDGAKAYVIVNGDVLDITTFAGGHPGGELALLEQAGKDVTKVFYALHRHDVIEKRVKRLKVGTLRGYNAAQAPPSSRSISAVPYAEIDMDNSPFWNDSHVR
jgi:cytochrome b involved in lipid metabolism